MHACTNEISISRNTKEILTSVTYIEKQKEIYFEMPLLALLKVAYANACAYGYAETLLYRGNSFHLFVLSSSFLIFRLSHTCM